MKIRKFQVGKRGGVKAERPTLPKEEIAPPKAEIFITIDRPVKHITKNSSFYRTCFRDLDGKPCWIDIPRKAFSNPMDVVAILLDAHASLPLAREDQKKCVTQALDHIVNSKTLAITDRVGWTETSGSEPSFVYFGETFGPARDNLSLDQDTSRNVALGLRSGTVDAWQKGLTRPCIVSDELIAAISIAASGPLYSVIGGTEAAIYHFEGARQPVGASRIHKSSSGKTLCARAAQSMFGRCKPNDLFSFNMTSLAVEETCFSCNHLVVNLDEAGVASEGTSSSTVKPEALPYKIIGGQSKRRSKAYSAANGLANQSWVVPVITTSEDELDASTSKRKEGARARMVSIPFPPTFEGGTFRSAKAQATALAQEVEATIGGNYGVATPEYIRYLVRHRRSIATDVVKLRDGFVQAVGATNDNWERRYAQKFGMLFAAGCILDRSGIAPWTEARAKEAITNVYKASRGLTVSVPQATDAFLKKMRKLVATGKRFPRVEKSQVLSPAKRKISWGAVRKIAGKPNITAVKTARYEKLVQPPAVAQAVLAALDARKLLLKDTDGNLKRQVLIKGLSKGRVRYVCVQGVATSKSSKA